MGAPRATQLRTAISSYLTFSHRGFSVSFSRAHTFSTSSSQAADSARSATNNIDAFLRNEADQQKTRAAEKNNLLNVGGRSFQGIIPARRDPQQTTTPPPRLTGGDPSYHFHVYSHKHNCHITLTKPDRNPLISVSTGNLGFKKSGRGTYDAAYQLAAYVLNRMNEDPKLMGDMKSVELILRGFGPGREAVTKAILGTEGVNLNKKITRVMDSTRLKFGGVRSPRPRRLG